MRSIPHTRLLVLGLAAALATFGCKEDDNTEEFLASPLTGQNEVPARTTSSTGEASFTFDGTTVRYTVTVRQLSAVTASHIHSGAVGVNGTIRVTLFTGAATGLLDGTLVQGSFSAADVSGITFDELLNEMRAGSAYVNVHTVLYPTGEIRAQLRQVD